MNSKTGMHIIALTLLAALAIPVQLAAQDQAKLHHPHQYHHYQIVDPGTFGGPQSLLGILNNRGTLTGLADTLTVDPYCLDYPDCFAVNAFQLRDGVATDLGVLPGGTDSQSTGISGNGLIAGSSDNGQQDPLNPAFPQQHAVLWDHGQMTDLGTLPEGGYSTGFWAATVNNRGEVAGQAYNAIPDPNSLFGYGYQSRAFYWKNGVMQDLGTLGTGTDAMAGLINERGQVVGESYLNSVPSAFCSSFTTFTLTTGSFIWDKKNGMQDIGTLGGTCTLAYDLNNRGQVVGESSQVGDPTNLAFVWDREAGIKPLPTGANLYGAAFAINDASAISGYGDAPDGQTNAILWRKTGGKWQATYLGNLHSGDCALGVSINASGQVVGNSGPNGCLTTLAFLWEDGGPMVDLNTLVPATSGIQLTEAVQINDRGEIAGNGVDANGNNHTVLLIPCDENHPDVDSCDYDTIDAETAAARPQSTAPSYVPNGTRLPRSWRSNRFHIPSSAARGGAAAIATQVSPVPDRTPPPPVFYIAATPLTPSSVNPGGSSTSTVTVYIGTHPVTTAALSCSVQPSPPLGATCSINPTSAAPATLTVSTFGPSGSLLSRPGSGLFYALWLPLIGMVATGVSLGSNRNGQKGKLKTVVLACALLVGLTFQTACGGGSHSSGTPAGTYTVTVTATAFIPVNTTSLPVVLTVQ